MGNFNLKPQFGVPDFIKQNQRKTLPRKRVYCKDCRFLRQKMDNGDRKWTTGNQHLQTSCCPANRNRYTFVLHLIILAHEETGLAEVPYTQFIRLIYVIEMAIVQHTKLCKIAPAAKLPDIQVRCARHSNRRRKWVAT